MFHGFNVLLRCPATDCIVEIIRESYESELKKQNICFVTKSSTEATKLSLYTFERSFVCPFCKKCTVERYFSKEGCPKKVAEKRAGTSLFPYLSVAHLDPNAVIDLEDKLILDTEGIKTKFADFSLMTKMSLAESPNNTLEDIAKRLHS